MHTLQQGCSLGLEWDTTVECLGLKTVSVLRVEHLGLVSVLKVPCLGQVSRLCVMNIHAIHQAADVCKNVTNMTISQESLLVVAAIIFFIHYFMLHFHLIIHISAQYTATSFFFPFLLLHTCFATVTTVTSSAASKHV